MLMWHCRLAVSSVLEEIQSYSIFEVSWLVRIGWMLEETKCLVGGLV